MTVRRTLTPLARVLRWLRGPWVAPDPAPDLSWLDRKDGLRGRTRYDAEWPDVLAAEARPRHADGFIDRNGNPLPIWLGGDLAAMAAPLPGMARDDLGTYAEPVEVHITADVSAFRDTMYRLAQDASMAKPRGRHRQTDPLDLILADLRDLGGL